VDEINWSSVCPSTVSPGTIEDTSRDCRSRFQFLGHLLVSHGFALTKLGAVARNRSTTISIVPLRDDKFSHQQQSTTSSTIEGDEIRDNKEPMGRIFHS